MRLWQISAVAMALASPLLSSQVSASDSVPQQAGIQPPQLVASKTDWPSLGHCGKSRFAWARVVMDVADDGTPQRIELMDSSIPELKETATDAVRDDRFTPGTKNGRPLDVHGIILLEMTACSGKVKLPDGGKKQQTWIEAPPKQSFWPSAVQPASLSVGDSGGWHGAYRVGHGVSAPVPILSPVAHFTDQARKDRIEGEVMLTLVVDANGMPQNPRVVRPLPAGLTDAAIEAVRKYRFRPALKNGKTPVPVMITIMVNFKLY